MHSLPSGALVSRSRRGTAIAVWILAYTALLGVLLWSAKLALPYLAVSLAALVGALVLLPRARGSRLLAPPLYLALGVLVLAAALGGYTTWRLGQLADSWPEIVEARDSRLRAELDRRGAEVTERG